MKKILLASTILAGTAGFAAADNANFTFSGEAYTGLAFVFGLNEVANNVDWNQDGDIDDTDATYFTPEVSAEFTVSMMTMTDVGLEVGASVTVEGAFIRVEDDHTEGDFGFPNVSQVVSVDFDDQGEFTGVWGNVGEVGTASVYLSGDFGKFEAAVDTGDLDEGQGDFFGSGDVDFTYTHTFGDFDVKAWYEYRFGNNNDEFGLEGTYNFSDYSIYAGFEYDEGYGGLSGDNGTGDSEVYVGATAAMNGFSAAVEAAYRLDTEEWAFYAEAGYSVDAYSFTVFAEDDDNGSGINPDDDFDFGVKASYDLGGGVSIDAAYIYDNDNDLSLAKAGVSSRF